MAKVRCGIIAFALTAALAHRARTPQADLTSQPSLNAFCASMAEDPRDPGIGNLALELLVAYWGSVRAMYAPFETAMLSGSTRVYDHTIPRGQVCARAVLYKRTVFDKRTVLDKLTVLDK